MDKKLTTLFLVFLLSFSLFATIVIFIKPLTQLTRASEENNPSPNSSLIFAYPLTVKADGKTTANLNVFVRSYKGTPLANKPVAVTTSLGQIKTISNITDKTGKATFSLTSQDKGVAEIEAVVNNNIKLAQKVTVKFE